MFRSYLPVRPTQHDFHAAADGISLTFTEPLDRASAEQVDNYSLKQWNYRWTATYGSEHYRVSDPARTGFDPVEVRGATLSDNGKTVFLEIDDLGPVMQLQISYTLTSAFGIPHGAAVALTLGPVLTFNARVNEADCVDCRGPESVQERLAIICETFGANSPEEADALFRQKVEAVNCPVTLSDAGIEGKELIDQICKQVNLERLANNPRRLTPVVIRKMLESIR